MLNNRKDLPEITGKILSSMNIAVEEKIYKEKKSKIDLESKIAVEKLIQYGLINRGNYNVLKTGGNHNKAEMTDKEILNFSIKYHKDLGLDWMVEHVLSDMNKQEFDFSEIEITDFISSMNSISWKEMAQGMHEKGVKQEYGNGGFIMTDPRQTY